MKQSNGEKNMYMNLSEAIRASDSTIKRSDENIAKTQNNIKAIFDILGINSSNLQNTKKEYVFDENTSKYIIRLVNEYTCSTIKDIRSRSFQKVPLDFFIETEKFIKAVMREINKDEDEVNDQIYAFRQKTNWTVLHNFQGLQDTFQKASEDFISFIKNECYIFNEHDVTVLTAEIGKRLMIQMKEILQKWGDIIYEIKDFYVDSSLERHMEVYEDKKFSGYQTILLDLDNILYEDEELTKLGHELEDIRIHLSRGQKDFSVI